ncbi:MAG: L-2-hydroxyglutarate oxidase [Rhodothermales bacterium]|nr:L-2-hydroxyglutarate oxidase [Rhodothermales bacterium]MBO6781199.1 L-2-hydroxyglutarate oxidase [Rhodothermales bacterium]
MEQFEVAVAGGGIVGLSTAYRLAQDGLGPIVVLEKEDRLAAHQTGRNSGVIHSGIYYKPGSLKARNCTVGRRTLVEFCERENLPYDMCGKVIVAVTEDEVARLRGIFERGQANGVACSWVTADGLREHEPHVTGLAAVHVEDAGITDYAAVCTRIAERATELGVEIRKGTAVRDLRQESGGMVVGTSQGDLKASLFVNCAGLHSDRIARMGGVNPGLRIVPFRGHYHELAPEAEHLCNTLIYPVPNPAYPFLGVHFTRMVNGGVECGPNALLAFAREGYRIPQVNLLDMWDYLRYSGFRHLMSEHWRQGIHELSCALFKGQYLKQLQRLIPAVRKEHLKPAPSGIRAQAVMPDGSMADDFLILERPHQIHVCNAPSPAATAGLQIGRTIADRVAAARAA